MLKKEKQVIKIMINELQEKFLNHNKNLTCKQFYCIEEIVEILRILVGKGGIDELIELAKAENKEK